MIDIEYRKRKFIMYIIGVSLEEDQNSGTFQIGTCFLEIQKTLIYTLYHGKLSQKS